LQALTDLQLIEDCLAGNKNSFGELIERYKNLVYSIILRKTNDHEEANDLAQDVFLKMYKNLHTYSPEFKFSTWTMRITTNHVIDFHRKRKAETVTLDDIATIQTSPEDTPEAELLRNEESARINNLVDSLPAMYRIPIEYYHQNGMSYQEIADKIDVPLSKVKNRIFRGRKLLKEQYLKLSGETPW
jgi:RNA polymerase sigma-70 factor (ECF subfamily)